MRVTGVSGLVAKVLLQREDEDQGNHHCEFVIYAIPPPLPDFPARKDGLNQKDFKSATIQAAPAISTVKVNSDQAKCAFG